MKAPQIQSRPCPACDATNYAVIARYSHPDWPIAECTECNFIYLKNTPSYEAFEDELAWEKSTVKEAKRREKIWIYKIDYATRFRLKLGNALDRHFVMSSVSEGGNVLDVGCGGVCRIADRLVPFGIEISNGLAERANPLYRARGGYVVNAPAVEGFDGFDDQFFDHAILRSYLEHETRPRLVLEKLYQKYKAGGTVAVKVPDYGCMGRRIMGVKWCGFRFPDHQNYFTRKSLSQMAESIGFTCKFSNVVPGLNDNLYAVLTKPPEPRKQPKSRESAAVRAVSPTS